MTAAGFARTIPNMVSAAALIVILVTHQIQVRLVEEPYLRRVHGNAYRASAERTGRFLPWIGRDRRNH
jgi:protein-S-isoprenylcysteine O-methyltransferase Ste14